jgi:hypothetical protein
LNAGAPIGFNLPTFFNTSEIPGNSTLNNLPTRADFLNARQRLLAPLGFLSNFTAFPAAGNSIYHGGSLNVKRRLTQGVSLDMSYTLSKTIDDSTNELFSSFVNPRRPGNFYDQSRERAESVLSRRHRLSIGWIWELPFYKNERGFLGQVLGNWQISGIYQAESGQLVDALSFNDANGDFDNAGDRTVINPNGDRRLGTGVNWVTRNGNVVAPGSVPNDQVVGYVAENPNAGFVFADTGALVTAARNLIQAPGLNNWDISFFKRFAINERHTIEFRAEMFNAFNHPQFVVDDPFATDFVDVTSPNFQNEKLFSGSPTGPVTITGVNPLTGGNPRVIQMVLRYRF